ncbi:cobalamin biosynthesis protein [Halorientalis sp. IM1011]|uniref:DUF3209 family protein n=1 Tax=Halorientalis sp. IM1011 TaxID=1932360 RepID=UPI00097CD039|nr:DUF3209 family protein [Halorientalis sp. IM1011]AQL43971.1 cobalamin biosynthesis protein [Halorientalis sp. IM1011]
MSCDELEALRLGVMTALGIGDESTREHARTELEGSLDGPIEALANAETLPEIERHLDAALVDLEEEVAQMDSDDPEYDYTRGRLVAVRDAERAIHRLTEQAESVLDGFGEAHHHLHEAFPVDE